MSTDLITTDVSKRICTHMNNDHKDAVIAYAHHYGGISKVNKAEMIEISSERMELDVDGKLIQIKFDHNLLNSEDAHRTLVEMLRQLPQSSQKRPK